MKGFLEYLGKAYAKTSDGFFAHSEMRLSPTDPTGGRVVGKWGYGSPHDGDPFVINVAPVGGRNAGTFRGWVTLSRAEWRRVTGARPAGWHSYTAVVGFAPDDETVWWSAIYDDDLLRQAAAEAMEDGRWYRIRPEEAGAALVASAESFQQTLGFDAATPTAEGPVISTRESVFETADAGLTVLRDPEAIKHLTADQIHDLKAKLIGALGALERWDRVREAQSYSQEKAKARKGK